MKSRWLILAFASAAVLTLTATPPNATPLSPAAFGSSFKDANILQVARFGHRHHRRHHRGLRVFGYGYGLPFIVFGGGHHRRHGGFGFGGFGGHHGRHHGGFGHGGFGHGGHHGHH